MKKLVLLILASAHWALAMAQGNAGGALTQSLPPLTTIASLDVPRYMGIWYEIAKYPNWFQKKCVADTRAGYQLQANGSVQVTNQCRLDTGAMDVAIGEARQIGPSTSPKLQVRFAPSWLSMLPFVWGNYWVIDLDEGYQLVAVSEPKREYLWVLSRTPTVATSDFDALMGRLKTQGFDLSRLERSKQQ
ncbi:lipocalin family protein [Rhodoferax sp.]|uniref:lipocalin family protein n=1 Tax=Rhodoferax sp. TaxID=50421 RepID=UPI00261D72F3|nr:lipocalin family protein [Rhodoferax sp.]MDD2809040.1 lipocalin family protein [Rhodoferax sp.]MDD4942374.1 lipocalin family protein [Rhodoferax sp.]